MATTQQLEIDIKAKSDKATVSLDALISKLNEVNSALNGLNTAKISQISKDLKGIKGVHVNGGSSSGGVGKSSYNATSTVNANKRAKSSFEQLLGAVTGCNRGFRGFGGTMANLAAKWGMFYAAMYPIIRLFKFFGKEVEQSMDYVETFNYFKVTMGKIGHDAGEEFVDEFTEQVEKLKDLNRKMTGFKLGKDGELIDANMSSLGIDPNIMMQFQAQIGAVTNSVGLLAKTSLNTQKALSMLSADLSSLKNEDLQAVMKNLQSGLIGQSRALYKYGIDITQATLKQYALAHGVTKSVSAMSQSEKMQLRLLAILDQSKVAWGDQANSINTVANQYRIMKQQISNLGRTIGNLFLPVVKTVLPYLNAFIIAMRKIFELLGKKIYGGNWQKQLTEGVSEGNFDGIVEGAEDSEEALNDATKAAKKFKQATMGFDELDIISPDSSSGSGTAKGGIGGGFNLDDDIEKAFGEYEKAWNEAWDKMQNKAEELANKLVSYVKNHDYFGLGRWLSDGIATGLEQIDWNSLKSESDKAGQGLAQLMNGLMSHRISWDIGSTVAQGLNTALTFVNSWAETFQWDEFGTNLAIGLKAFLVNWDAGLTGETFSNFATGILQSMTSILNTSMDRTTFKTFGQKVVDFICGIKWGSLTWNMGTFIQAFYDAIIDFPADFFIGVFDRVLDKVFGEETETRKKIDRQLKRIKFKEHLEDALTFVLGLVHPIIWIRFAFKDKTFEGVTKGIKNSWNKVVDWWNTEGATKWMKDDVKPHFSEEEWTSDGLKDGIGASWNKVTEWWSTNGASFWLDRDVDPYFQKERWTHPEISEGLSESWNKFTEWWSTNGASFWLDRDVNPYFQKERWTHPEISEGLSESWNKFTEWWSTTGIYKWWTEHVEPYFDEKKWIFEGIKKGLTQAWKNAISSIKSLWNSFADHMNENFKIHIDAKEIAGHKLWDAQDFTLLRVPKFTIPAYSIGGFPEDGLFYANHNELVGQFNNGQTTVANNEQIIAGIQNGVAQAVHQELAPILRQIATNTGDTANNTDAIAKKPVQNITDRGIAKANLRGQRSLGLQLRTT